MTEGISRNLDMSDKNPDARRASGSTRPPDTSDEDETDKTKDQEFPFNLTDEELENLVDHEGFQTFLEDYDMTKDEFLAYIETGKERISAGLEPLKPKKKEGDAAEAWTSKTAEAEIKDSDKTEERLRQDALQRFRDQEKAALNHAIYAARIREDAEIAFKTGKTLPPSSVTHIERPRPTGGTSIPAVVSSAGTRMIISTDTTTGGLRAPSEHYKHLENKVRAMARLFVHEQGISIHGDDQPEGERTPPPTSQQTSSPPRSSRPQSRGKHSSGKPSVLSKSL